MILLKRRAPAVKPPGSPQLVALTEGINIPLDKPIVLIGRHQECDIQIPSRKISRRHCCIALVTDHLVIRDLGSTNGIRINGVKVVEGNLQTDDELTIGNMRYHLKWSAEAQPLPRQPFKQVVLQSAHEPNLEESSDNPMPLPDAVLSKEVQLGKAKSALEIPSSVVLVPLNGGEVRSIRPPFGGGR